MDAVSWPDWRYLFHGRVKHAIGPTNWKTAKCGTGPAWFDDWRGTGTQDEYERLAALPACQRCIARGYKP